MPELVLATEAEKSARDRLTCATWGGGLSPEQFLLREQALRAHPFARGGLCTWLWQEGAEVLGSCETFAVPALLGPEPGRAWVVASVFVEDRLRGAGHATAMLSAVGERLSREPGALAVVLFSEVGTGLYERVGFRAAPGTDCWFAPESTAPPEVAWLAAPLPAPRPPPPVPGVLAFPPSALHLDWQLERERFYAAALHRQPLEVHGAARGTSSITWTAYWKTNELHVLTLDVDDAGALPSLLHAARHAAFKAGLAVVRAWETTPLAHLPGARQAARTDEIVMMRPLHPAARDWHPVERGLWA